MMRALNFLWLIIFLNQSIFAATLVSPQNIVTEDKPVITMNADQPEFILKLKSNPTTGYSWFLKSYDEKIVTPLKHKYQAPTSQLAGASGYEFWTFRIKPAGFVVPQQTLLQFVYARPWEAREDAQSFIVKITTTSAPSVSHSQKSA